MPRKDDSPQVQNRRDPPVDPETTGPSHLADAVPEAWLDNPRNIQTFFDAIERARKAKGGNRPS
jgi:hypothetical protein